MDEERATLDQAIDKAIDHRLAALGPAVPTLEQAETILAATDEPALIPATVDVADLAAVVLESDTRLLIELRREIRSLRARLTALENRGR